MPTFTQLRFGNILGIIDYQGAVKSKFSSEKVGVQCHHYVYPFSTHRRWRWSYREGITRSVLSLPLDEEEFDAVQRHLTKRYGIQWFDNGFHDLDHFIKQLRKEEKKVNRKSRIKY